MLLKFFPVCICEILQVKIKLKFYHLFRSISDDFLLKVPKKSLK